MTKQRSERAEKFASPVAAKAARAKVAGRRGSPNRTAPRPLLPREPAVVVVPESTQRLELALGTSRKFWQVRRDDDTVTVQFGKLGTQGHSQVTTFPNEWEARTAVRKRLETKKQKGYQLVITGPAPAAVTAASDPALERAILANPDSDDAFMVYADWLQQQGDVRGELAAIQAQLATSPKDKKLKHAEQKLLWEHGAHFWGPIAAYVGKQPDVDNAVIATWRHGFIDTLELSAYEGYDDRAGPSVQRVEELVALVPQVASAKLVRELTIGKPVANAEYSFEGAVAALMKVLPALPNLRRLSLGKFGDFDCELSWSDVGNLEALWPLVGKLEYLKIKAGKMMLGKIDAPNLRELRIETGGLGKKAIAQLVTAKLPKLETLSVWFGQENYGFDGRVTDLLPFLDKRNFPKVKHLAVANTIYGDELAAYWPTATILPQLETLDLSRSHLTIAGVRKLAAQADAFAHLKTLDLSQCLLKKDGQRLAHTLCANVIVEQQNDPSEYQPDNDEDPDDDRMWRYTAVGE